MFEKVMIVKMVVMIVFCVMTVSCDQSDDKSGGGDPTAYNAGCQSNGDCDGGVCIRLGDASACHPKCTAGGNECSGSAGCNDVVLVSVNYCTEKKVEPVSQEDPPKPEEQPRVACLTDQDCKQFDGLAICAQYQGKKDCTLPCEQENQCDVPELPAVGGVKVSFDFMTCLSDEADQTRKACLPDQKCFKDIMSCVSGFPNLNDKDSGFDFDSNVFDDADSNTDNGDVCKTAGIACVTDEECCSNSCFFDECSDL